jgi:hypothetical protein
LVAFVRLDLSCLIWDTVTRRVVGVFDAFFRALNFKGYLIDTLIMLSQPIRQTTYLLRAVVRFDTL